MRSRKHTTEIDTIKVTREQGIQDSREKDNGM